MSSLSFASFCSCNRIALSTHAAVTSWSSSSTTASPCPGRLRGVAPASDPTSPVIGRRPPAPRRLSRVGGRLPAASPSPDSLPVLFNSKCSASRRADGLPTVRATCSGAVPFGADGLNVASVCGPLDPGLAPFLAGVEYSAGLSREGSLVPGDGAACEADTGWPATASAGVIGFGVAPLATRDGAVAGSLGAASAEVVGPCSGPLATRGSGRGARDSLLDGRELVAGPREALTGPARPPLCRLPPELEWLSCSVAGASLV
mmetsp:Transcript_63375/g.145792  ORF Transcript_63375/g.145792 Transcript_63375/m.145792 type:complete len:260 (+) Transcript_63375:1166-1945(+)